MKDNTLQVAVGEALEEIQERLCEALTSRGVVRTGNLTSEEVWLYWRDQIKERLSAIRPLIAKPVILKAASDIMYMIQPRPETARNKEWPPTTLEHSLHKQGSKPARSVVQIVHTSTMHKYVVYDDGTVLSRTEEHDGVEWVDVTEDFAFPGELDV
jgi:hypothetical protein